MPRYRPVPVTAVTAEALTLTPAGQEIWDHPLIKWLFRATIAMCQPMDDEAGDKLTGLACHEVKPDSEAFPVH